MTYDMMLHRPRIARRWVAIPLVLLLFALVTTAYDPGSAVHAQDTGAPAQDRVPTEELVARAAKAATDAGLTDEQSSTIRSILDQAEPAPGVLWTIAGSIHQKIGTEATRTYAASLRPDRSEMRGRCGGPQGAKPNRSGRRGGPDGPGSQPLLDELDVTDEQLAEIAEIRSSYRSQMRDLRSQRGRLSPDEREQMRALRDEMREEMRSVLTEEQVAELDELRGQRMAVRAERRVERQTARDASLNLTEEQAKQLSVLRAEGRANRQRGTRPNGSVMREAMTEILSDDQQAVVELHRSLMMHMRAEMGQRGPRGMRRNDRR